MATPTPKPRRRVTTRETVAVYVESESVRRVDDLVRSGVVINRSAAFDDALLVYLTAHEQRTDGEAT